MNVQIRLRVDESFARIPYIADWLAAAPRGFAFEHSLPNNHHYHIYLFDLQRNTDAMRRHLAKFIPDKQRYAVGVTCGGNKKLKITPEGAYQYGTTRNANTPIWSKGFTPTELEDYHKSAEKYYNVPIVASLEDGHLPEVIYKVDRVWEKLRDHADDYRDMTIARIKSKISVDYLNNGKAIPRSADLHRYAMSLFYLNKYKNEETFDQIPDTALEEYYQNVKP